MKNSEFDKNRASRSTAFSDPAVSVDMVTSRIRLQKIDELVENDSEDSEEEVRKGSCIGCLMRKGKGKCVLCQLKEDDALEDPKS